MSVGVEHRPLEESNTALLGEIRRLVAQQDRQAKWLDELSAKINKEDMTKRRDSNETLFAWEPSAPTSPNAKYQATVEDDVDGEGDGVSISKSLPSRWETLENPPSVPLSTSLPPTPVPSPTKPAARVHFSNRRPVVLHNKTSECYFPAKETVPLSPVDSTWGTLFVDGVATERMRSMLRGLAKYIISEYVPINSLVIPIDKMYKFYSRYKLQSEAFPFLSLFESTSKESMRNLEFVYLDFGCEYHHVQDPSSPEPTRPFIPALTPKGFVQWQSRLIAAFPNCEAQRLSAVVADLALEAVTDNGEKPQRLPRQLSHHLFPSKRDNKIYRDVVDALADWKRAMTPSISQGAPVKTYKKESGRYSDRDAIVVIPRRSSDSRTYEKSRNRSPPRRSVRDITPENKKTRRYSLGKSPPDKERGKRGDESEYRKRAR